jgi:hypothetical protein
MVDLDAARHWPVLAWIRLNLPEPPAPLMLTKGPPPPPSPPLDLLESEPVATDPNVRLYSHSEALDEGLLRLFWQADNPLLLTAEYREAVTVSRLAPEKVRRFWETVKARVQELGPLSVEGADPFPR